MADIYNERGLSGALSFTFSDPVFQSAESSNKGIYVNQTIDKFLTDNNITDEQEKKDLFNIARTRFSEYKTNNNINRYIPNQEEQSVLYSPLKFAPEDNQETKIQKIDAWKNESLAKASALRPADADDISVHLDSIANEQIRKTVGVESGWIEDKSKRLVQGAVQPIASLFNYEGSERFFAEHFTENPDMDEDFSAQVAAGIGDSMVQVGLALGTNLVSGPAGAATAITSYNATRMMKDAYKEEMKRSGDSEMALNNAVAQLPAVALESAGDIIFTGIASKLGGAGLGFSKRFAEAATDEAKRQVLKEAIPTLGGAVLKSGLSEATLGGMGSEFTSGYGSYIATGDEKYLRSFEEIAKSGLVEGAVGALFGGAMVNLERNGIRSEISKELTGETSKQSEIYSKLKAKDYQGVLNTLNNNITTEAAPVAEASTAANSSSDAVNSTNPTPQSTNFKASGVGLFSKGEINGAKSIVARYEALPPDSPLKESQKALYERNKATLSNIETNQFAEVDEFSGELLPDDAVFVSSDPKPSAPPRPVSVELTDGSVLPDDGYSYVVYTDNKAVSKKSFNKLQALHGDVNIGVSNDYRTGKLYLDAKDGSKVKAQSFKISLNPKEGWTPIVVYDGSDLNENGKLPRRIKVLPAVASFENIKDLNYVDSYFDSDGNLTSVSVEKDGKMMNIKDPVAAYEIATKAREDSIKESIGKSIPKRVEANNIIEETKETPEEKDAKLEEEILGVNESELSDGSLQSAFDSFNDVKDLSVEDQFARSEDILPRIQEGIAQVESKVKDLSGRPGADKYINDLNDLWYFLSSVNERLTSKRVVDEDFVQSETPGALNTPQLNENEVETQVEKVNKTLTPANSEGKIVIVNGDRGYISIDGPDAYLDINGKKQYLAGKDFPLLEIEGFEGGAGIPFKKQANKKKNPPKARAVESSQNAQVVKEVEEVAVDPEVNNNIDYNLLESRFFNNYVKIPGVSFNETVSFLDSLSDPERKYIADIRGLNNDSESIAVGFGKRKQAVFNTVRERPLAQGERTTMRERDARGDILSDQEREEARLLEASVTGNDSARVNTITGEIERDDEGDFSYSLDAVQENVAHLSPQEITTIINDKFGVKPNVVEESFSNVNGKEVHWFGRSDVVNNNIELNASRLTTPEQAVRTFIHEVSHLGYNQFSSEADLVLRDFFLEMQNNGQSPDQFIQDLKTLGYNDSQIDEELVVGRVEDLYSKYDSTGKFKKLINKIITWIKQKFGIKLNQTDINVIAERIFSEGLKKLNPTSNFGGNNLLYSIDGPVEADIFALVTNKLSDNKKEAIAKIAKLQSKKLEASLRVDEKPAFKALKNVEYYYLSDASLSEYLTTLDNFVSTRSKVKEPTANRIEIEQVQNRAVALIKESHQGKFEFLQSLHPEILEGKDFESDYSSDLSAVKADIDQANATIPDVSGPDDDFLEYIDKATELQDVAIQNILSDEEVFNDMFGYLEPAKTGDEILDKSSSLVKQFREDTKDIVKDYLNYMVNVDVSSITSFKELRNFYYNLLSITTDGYPAGMDKFVTTDLKNILNQKGIKFRDANKKTGSSFFENLASFQTNLNSIAGTKEASDAIYAINSKFRESINNSERYEKEIMTPYLEKIMKEAEKKSGRAYNNEDLIQMGIFGYMRQYRVAETKAEGLKATVEWLDKSFSHYDKSKSPKLKNASKWQKEFLHNTLLNGIDLNNIKEGDYDLMISNGNKFFDQGQVGYLDGVIKLFESLKPMSQFTTEFIHGDKFDDIYNYIPSSSMMLFPGDRKADQNSIEMDMQSKNIANGMIGTRDPNLNKTGMSSTKVRHRVLGEGRILDLNINRLALNMSRLNSLDYFTSARRYEMVNVLNSQELKDWLGDSENQNGRSVLFRKVHKQLWSSIVNTTNYLGDWHATVNWVTGRMMGAKLFSVHTFFTQTASNSITYFAQNVNQPNKIIDFFNAFDVLAKAESDPIKHELFTKITSGITNRSQDAILDKSASLDIDGKSMFQEFKKTGVFKGVRDLDNLRDKIMFAPFRLSDDVSGKPMIMAEYLAQERIRTNTPDMTYDNMTYNSESYFKALDETERMIGIGHTSRRGEWMNNTSASISLLRNMFMMFASHRVNNATNFGIALKDLSDPTLSSEDKSRQMRYMFAISAQTASFNLLKAGIAVMIGQLILKIVRGGEDDDLESLYEKNKAYMSKTEKETLKQEISLRKDIRKITQGFENRNSSLSTLGMNMLGDMFSNIHFIPAMTDIPRNAILNIGYDMHSEKAFKEVKDEEIKRLEILKKNSSAFGDKSKAAQLEEAIADLKGQEYMSLTFEKKSLFNMSGIFGPFLDQNFGVAKQAVGALLHEERFGAEDWAVLLGTYGLGQPDFQKYLNLRAKLAEATAKGEAAKEKARQKVLSDHKGKF